MEPFENAGITWKSSEFDSFLGWEKNTIVANSEFDMCYSEFMPECSCKKRYLTICSCHELLEKLTAVESCDGCFDESQNAVVLWAMHPWERDARLMKEALKDGPDSYNVLIEVACTRSSEELLGARRAYHSLYEHSIEEDVASHVHGPERRLLVALVSAYRYEGTKPKEDNAKAEAKTILNVIKSGEKKTDNEEVIRILTTRSKLLLKAVYKDYQEISGSNLDEDLKSDSRLQETVQCLCTPERYFSQVLDLALEIDADKSTKKALTRVIVTRADVDVKEIDEEFNKMYGVHLTKKIEDTANGNYKDFLLRLIAKGD